MLLQKANRFVWNRALELQRERFGRQEKRLSYLELLDGPTFRHQLTIAQSRAERWSTTLLSFSLGLTAIGSLHGTPATSAPDPSGSYYRHHGRLEVPA